jgi:DNA-binding transcriptional regulator GbsR (MarR family)
MSNRLPREILEKAIQLRDPLKTVFIALYSTGKPCTATEIAQLVGKARAYVCMRLNQLVDMKLVETQKKGKYKLYQVITNA